MFSKYCIELHNSFLVHLSFREVLASFEFVFFLLWLIYTQSLISIRTSSTITCWINKSNGSICGELEKKWDYIFVSPISPCRWPANLTNSMPHTFRTIQQVFGSPHSYILYLQASTTRMVKIENEENCMTKGSWT